MDRGGDVVTEAGTDEIAPVEVRFYAAARAAAGGLDSTSLSAPTLMTLRDALTRVHGLRMARVLASCSFLLDGVCVAHDEDVPLGGVITVDVLPPFAGG
jgi:molybdopterin converting factor small subunit